MTVIWDCFLVCGGPDFSGGPRREIRTWIGDTTLILQINQTLTDPVRPLSSVQTTLQVGKRQVSLQILQKSLVIGNYGVSLQHNNTTADHVLLYTLTRILQSHTCTITENIITVTKTNVHVDFHSITRRLLYRIVI